MTQVSVTGMESLGLSPGDGACAERRRARSLSDRILSLLKSRSLKQGVVVLADQGIASLTTFVAGVLIARACAADCTEFGHYVFGMTLVVTILGFQRGLVSLPYTVLSPHLESDWKAIYLGSVIVHQALIAGLVFAGFVLAGTIMETRIAVSGMAPMWLPLSAAIVSRLMLDFVKSILLADLRVWASLAVGLISSVAMLGILAWDHAAGRLCVSRAFLILAACYSVPSVVALVLIRRRIRFRFREVGREFSASFRIGKWMAATDTAFVLSRQMIPWVLAATWGPGELALLGVCEGASGVIGYTSRGVSAFFLPKLSQAAGSPHRLKHMVIRSLVLLTPVATVCLLVAWLAGDWLMVTLYSSCYRGLRGPLVVCCASASLGLVSAPVNQAIHAIRRSDIGFKALVCSLPLSLCLGSLLTWRFGLWGACVSTFLGVAGAFAHRAFFLARHLSGRNEFPSAPVRGPVES